MLKKIVTLVKRARHCVLATAGPEGPHASLMAYAAPQDAAEFWLASLPDTRKFRNLAADPRASLLIDERDNGLALVVSVRLLPFDAGEAAARAALVARHPELAAFLGRQEVRMLRFAPVRFEFLEGATDVFWAEPEKKLDGSGLRA